MPGRQGPQLLKVGPVFETMGLGLVRCVAKSLLLRFQLLLKLSIRQDIPGKFGRRARALLKLGFEGHSFLDVGL